MRFMCAARRWRQGSSSKETSAWSAPVLAAGFVLGSSPLTAAPAPPSQPAPSAPKRKTVAVSRSARVILRRMLLLSAARVPARTTG